MHIHTYIHKHTPAYVYLFIRVVIDGFYIFWGETLTLKGVVVVLMKEAISVLTDGSKVSINSNIHDKYDTRAANDAIAFKYSRSYHIAICNSITRQS